MTKIELKDPADLRLHPLRKRLTVDPREELNWNSFVDGMSGAGPEGVPPIFITPDGQVMDGWRRHQAARQLGWPEIQCIVRPEEDCAVLMIESLMGQRDLQRCVKVYIAVCILKEFVESAEHRRLSGIKKGRKTLEKPLSSNLTKLESLRALGEKFGVSYETVRRAADVHAIFQKHPEIKAVWEPRLLCGDKNLWNVLSAVGGAGADQGGRDTQLEFWSKPWSALQSAAPGWAKLDENQREAVMAGWRETASALPADLREQMRDVLDEVASEPQKRRAA